MFVEESATKYSFNAVENDKEEKKEEGGSWW
jgi:hypothetical protein